jgi:hypothetical protein
MPYFIWDFKVRVSPTEPETVPVLDGGAVIVNQPGAPEDVADVVQGYAEIVRYCEQIKGYDMAKVTLTELRLRETNFVND